MKFDCPNGVQLTVDPASGVTVRVLPGGTMEIQGPKKAGGGKLAAAIAVSIIAGIGLSFPISDLLRNQSEQATAAAAENLARYPAMEAPRIRGAEPPEWVQRLPQYGVVPPAQTVPTNRGAAPSVEVPTARQEPQNPFGLDAP